VCLCVRFRAPLPTRVITHIRSLSYLRTYGKPTTSHLEDECRNGTISQQIWTEQRSSGYDRNNSGGRNQPTRAHCESRTRWKPRDMPCVSDMAITLKRQCCWMGAQVENVIKFTTKTAPNRPRRTWKTSRNGTQPSHYRKGKSAIPEEFRDRTGAAEVFRSGGQTLPNYSKRANMNRSHYSEYTCTSDTIDQCRPQIKRNTETPNPGRKPR
jgi:hypothetical protein